MFKIDISRKIIKVDFSSAIIYKEMAIIDIEFVAEKLLKQLLFNKISERCIFSKSNYKNYAVNNCYPTVENSPIQYAIVRNLEWLIPHNIICTPNVISVKPNLKILV